MDDATGEKATAAVARVEALERENRELRERFDSLEKEHQALRDMPRRGPDRHSGARVVAGMVLTIASIFGAAVLMYAQIRTGNTARPMPGGGVVVYPSPGHRYIPPPAVPPVAVPQNPAP